MALYTNYLEQSEFTDYEDFRKHFKLKVPQDFNFAYDVVDKMAEIDPDKAAMLWVSKRDEARTFTFGDISRLSDKTANYLRSLGIKKGDMVLLILKRHYQFWYTMMALHKLGAIPVPATNQLMPKDIEYRCNAGDIKLIISTGDGDVPQHIRDAALKCKALENIAAVNGPQEGFLDFDAGVEAASEEFTRPTGDQRTDKDDIMLVFFSSGTTGYPKMVAHTCTYPLGHLLTGVYWHQVKEDGLHFTISETGWGKALWGKLYGQWLGGCCVFTYDFDRFDPRDILGKIQKYKVTSFCAPPTMYRLILKAGMEDFDLSSVKHSCTAGEALPPEVFNEWKKYTGLEIFEAFGQTETTAVCSTCYPYTMPHIGSMGLPSPGYRVAVVDENGNEVGEGVTGEICVRTDEAGGGKPCGLFAGYYKNEQLTREAWHDGLYHTGDTAYKDEQGFLWYVGRVDDVIKSSGYRIGPFEVESALLGHPAVLECAVTGVADPVRGTVVKATIVLMEGYTGSPELTKEIQNYVKHVTAPYKYPRVIEYADSLPKTISGKIRRVAIRERDKAKE